MMRKLIIMGNGMVFTVVKSRNLDGSSLLQLAAAGSGKSSSSRWSMKFPSFLSFRRRQPSAAAAEEQAEQAEEVPTGDCAICLDAIQPVLFLPGFNTINCIFLV